MVLATTSFSVLAEATAPLFGLTTWSNDLEAADHRYKLRSILVEFVAVVSILKFVRQTEVLWLDRCMWQIVIVCGTLQRGAASVANLQQCSTHQ